MNRLHPSTLHRLDAAVARPRYARAGLGAAIVHLGIGAFARAHLCVVNEAALAATGDLRWGCIGVSLRQSDTRDALQPQAGLYTVATRDAGADGVPRQAQQVIGNLLGVHVAGEDPQAVVELIAAAETRIVSLTVTEKGYCHDPATGALRWDHPDIAHDLAHPGAPRSALGFIVRGLQRRHALGRGPLTLLSLDNLPANGHTLRGLVLAFAAHVDARLHDWIATSCRFPNSMVDRIVPRTTEADRAAVAAGLGLHDAWPVVAEPFLDWAVEDDFAAGRPAWDAGGARFVAAAEPFEKLKLRMVNGAHSALAYLGAVAGWATVDAAVAQAPLRGFVDALLRDEIAPTLPAIDGLDLEDYRRRLLQRFANPALQHRTQQIAMDGSQKLPQRWLAALRERLQAGASFDGLALCIAAWLHYLRGVDEAGQGYDIVDPLAGELAALYARAEAAATGPAQPAEAARVATLLSFKPVFGDLGRAAGLAETVARRTRSLRERGVLATLGEGRG